MSDHLTDEQLGDLWHEHRHGDGVKHDDVFKLIAQAREANRLREALATAQAETITEVVRWLRGQAEQNKSMAAKEEAEDSDGSFEAVRRWWIRVDETQANADMIESGEWAKEE